MRFSWNPAYRPGMRAVKTAIAVTLSLFIGWLMHGESYSMFYAAIASVICMQPTLDKTKHIGVARFIGTLIGGIVGYFVLLLLLRTENYSSTSWLYILIDGVGILVVITLCNLTDQKESSSIACIVFLNLVTHFDRTTADAFLYVLYRVIDTGIGILVAAAVNWCNFERFGIWTKSREK